MKRVNDVDMYCLLMEHQLTQSSRSYSIGKDSAVAENPKKKKNEAKIKKEIAMLNRKGNIQMFPHD